MRPILMALILAMLSTNASADAFNGHRNTTKALETQQEADIRLLTLWQTSRTGTPSVYRRAVTLDEAVREYLISKGLIDAQKWAVKRPQ